MKDENGQKEKVYPIDISSLSEVIAFGESVKAKYAVSRKNGAAYKLTLIKGHHSVWKDTEYDRMTELLKASNCRFFIEGNCLKIVSEGRDKGAGIEEMCGWLAEHYPDAEEFECVDSIQGDLNNDGRQTTSRMDGKGIIFIMMVRYGRRGDFTIEFIS